MWFLFDFRCTDWQYVLAKKLYLKKFAIYSKTNFKYIKNIFNVNKQNTYCVINKFMN